MNRWQAIQTFWGSFNLPAYDENTVPDDAIMPYITYESRVSNFDEPVLLTATIWYNSTLWNSISDKADQISDYIGSGTGISYTGGRLWITKEPTFAQRMASETKDNVRRIVITVKAEFQ